MPHFQGAKQRKGRDLNIYCRLKGTINHPENAGKIGSEDLFYKYPYPLHMEKERSYAVYLSHCKWPAPANPLSMYNSVSVVNMHNASTVHLVLC